MPGKGPAPERHPSDAPGRDADASFNVERENLKFAFDILYTTPRRSPAQEPTLPLAVPVVAWRMACLCVDVRVHMCVHGREPVALSKQPSE